MFGKLKTLLRKRSDGGVEQSQPFDAPLAPDEPFVAIGDVHGCIDPLNRLLDRISNEYDPRIPLVFLGDLIDRGPHSAAVIELAYTLSQNTARTVVCIMGNHERMLLDFIDDPIGRGLRWLPNGGTEALQSYGLQVSSAGLDVEDALDLSREFETKIPKEHLAWLRGLPLMWTSGNVACVHAAMDPAKPVTAQDRRVLQWGTRAFFSTPRDDGIWAVHGHTIVRAPTMNGGRIAVDTGAYQTGRLTAAMIDTDRCEFLSSEG